MARLALISGIGTRRGRRRSKLGAWPTTGPVSQAFAPLGPPAGNLAGAPLFKGIKKAGKKLVCEAKTAFINRKYARAVVLATAALGKRLGKTDKIAALAILNRTYNAVKLGKI